MVEFWNRKLAEEFGTPLFVYSEDAIIKNYERIKRAFPYPITKVLYAAMANHNPFILETMRDLGLGVQIESENELDLMLSRGFERGSISYTSCGTSEKTLEKLYKECIRVNFESLGEIEDYGRAAERLKGDTPVNGIRIYTGDFEAPKGSTNPSVDSNIGIRQDEIQTAKNIAEALNLSLGGVHGYAASNVSDVEHFKTFADYITDIAKVFGLVEYLNFGGGFSLDADLEEVGRYYAKKVSELSRETDKDIILEIEPGRFLVASAGVLLTTVTRIKPIRNGTKQIYVDAGMGEFARPYVYGTETGGFHKIELVGADSGVGPNLKNRYDIRAATVLQGDFFGKGRVMPDLIPGDILAIMDAGAYAMSSGFPKPKPISKSIFVTKEGKVVAPNFKRRPRS